MTFQTLDLAGLLGLAWSLGIATAVLIRGAALRDLERQAARRRHPSAGQVRSATHLGAGHRPRLALVDDGRPAA